jgi:hypothetical protein
MAQVFKEKHVVLLRPRESAVLQKKSSLCRYVHEMSLAFHNKHVVTARVTYV